MLVILTALCTLRPKIERSAAEKAGEQTGETEEAEHE
jgi:hypothetical protein